MLIKNLEHVFCPEVKVNCALGKVGIQGAHYYPILEKLEKEGLIKIHDHILNPDGTHKFKWSYHGSEPKNSSCFPADWTEAKIVQKINESLKNMIVSEWKKDGRFLIFGRTSEGVVLKIVFEFQASETKNICKMISCYPIDLKG